MVDNLIVCGGTFDHFHKGHESFLNYALSLGGRLIVGLTSDEYVENSKLKTQNSKLIEPFEKRKESVLEFVKKEKVFDKVEIIKIEDLFGPTLSKDFTIDGIVVSEDTKKGADIINRKRRDLGLDPLKIFTAPSITSEDGKIISSYRIRNGEINRRGRLYVNPAWLKADLFLPENLRQELKRPFGELCQEIDLKKEQISSWLITVGDATSKIFNEKALGQNLSVIDFKIARKKKFTNIEELGFCGDEIIFKANNQAGFITSALFKKIIEVLKFERKRIILQVNGEEDLVVLPLILAVSLGTVICYGQPGTGLVKILVSERIKEKAYDLASKFRPIKTTTRGY